MPGPLPKPPEERERRNKTGENGLGDEEFYLPGKVRPPRGVTFENEIIQDLWDALQESVNVQFYEPTDWIYARLTLDTWDKVLTKDKIPGAMLLSALESMMSKLLITEGDRRRLRIFAKRERNEVKDQVKASDFYKRAFDQHKNERRHLSVATKAE